MGYFITSKQSPFNNSINYHRPHIILNAYLIRLYNGWPFTACFTAITAFFSSFVMWRATRLFLFLLLMFTPLYKNKWRRGSGAPLGLYTLGIWPLITLNQTDWLLRVPAAHWLLLLPRPRRRSRACIPIYSKRRR